MKEKRIKLSMSWKNIVLVMSDRNLDAMILCSDLLTNKRIKKIDPYDMFGGLGVLMSLDSCGIWGRRIQSLWKDVCEEDLVNFIAVLRAVQLGGLAGVTEDVLIHAIDNHGDGVDLEKVISAVKKELPDFNSYIKS